MAITEYFRPALQSQFKPGNTRDPVGFFVLRTFTGGVRLPEQWAPPPKKGQMQQG